MKTLDSHFDDYLRTRRILGYDLAFTERVLRKFTAFADDSGADRITGDLFLQWKTNYGSANNNTWSTRLGMVRGFAGWLQGIDPRHEVPPAGLIVGKLVRARPYIYAPDQIAEIVAEAERLTSDYGLRGKTCSTLFGLIAVTGLRVSEAVGLNDGDVDLEDAVVTVHRGKNGRSRFVPIKACTLERLAAYRMECERLLGQTPASFFRLEGGQRPSDCTIRYNFACVCQRIGLRDRQAYNRHGRGPRIHDLRHTFAVRTIIDWYRNGLDADRQMAKLSTYLGHSSPEHTYWYIEAVPELMRLAADRAPRSSFGGRT
ncbi:MAG: tyrosine-type recombinase/integrase [Alphaproteobacteria bacterium]|nr:tyrosine-type recombinase/integrase [Alphaproteobacteria bacterium]